ncbi:MAG: restriction endonuclease subunit S [Bacillota bacterium]|jgi:hypothetical protein
MRETIDAALNVMYQHQLMTREQMLNEMLRVKLVERQVRELNSMPDPKELFRLMQQYCEEQMGTSSLGQDAFYQIYRALQPLDLLDFTLAIYENDRTGTIITPKPLNEYIANHLHQQQPAKVLIAEAEKHLAGLNALIDACPGSEFTLTTQLHTMYYLLQLLFVDAPHVRVVFESIYSRLLDNSCYDFIYAMPAAGQKPDVVIDQFITRESEGIALENLMDYLADEGALQIVLPVKIAFASQGYDLLRQQLVSKYGVSGIYALPDGIFRPASSVKYHLFCFARQAQARVTVGELRLTQGRLQAIERRVLSHDEFAAHADWRLELLLSTEDKLLRHFQDSRLSKVRLGDVAEVFRGKSILKNDTGPGEVAVLNLSNIEGGEIDYTALDTIGEPPGKVARYVLAEGDVVLSCRGTAIKSAVFRQQERTVIASANLVVIRPGQSVLPAFLQVFLQSPLGLAMVKSLQRGTVVMNLNHLDIAEMRIPLLPLPEQRAIAERYLHEQAVYKRAVAEAENRWGRVRQELYDRLLGEGLTWE